MKAKTCIGVGVVLLLLGLVIILIGCFAIPYEVPKQKVDYLVVDSKHSAQFKDWAGEYDKKNNYQMVFHFFNLTNEKSVRVNATKPIYTTAGPYIYRRYRQAQDVEFLAGNTKVQFLDFRDYQYDKEASGGLSNADIIFNFNAVYLAALQQAGGEQQMIVASAGGAFNNITNYFTGPFLSLFTSFNMPGYLSAAVNKTLESGITMDTFLEVWCNSTTGYSTGDWKGLLLSSHFNKSTNISKLAAQSLLNPALEYSLLNNDDTTVWAWDQALNNTKYSNAISVAFGLTMTQIEAIWYWRIESFGPTFMYNSYIQMYALETIHDIGWVQWNTGGLLGPGVSVANYPDAADINILVTPEVWTAGDGESFPDWKFAKKVMDPISGVGNISNYQSLILAVNGNLTGGNYSQWGMNFDQAQIIFAYGLNIGYGQVAPMLQSIYGDSGGLILNQTVDTWIFNCNTFLVDLLLPDPPSCNLLNNHSVFANVTIYSGKGNISQINEYVDWQGSSIISGIWKRDVPVSGCTELGQFAPNQNNNTVLHTLNDEFVRVTTLRKNTSSTVKGIKTNQFVLDYNDMFSVNDLYFQTIPGFTNMTTVRGGPVYYSLWDMHYVAPIIKNTSTVLNATNTTEYDCNTNLDVEPITGNTVRAHKRLQANLYTPPHCTWCNNPLYSYFGNAKIPWNTFFPLVKAGEYVEISDDLAAQVRFKLKALKLAPRYGLIVGLVLGGLVVIGGAAMILVGRNRRNDYYTIDDK